MYNSLENFYMLPGMSPAEEAFLQNGLQGMTEQQRQTFIAIYATRRKNPQDMLMYCIIGLLVVPGLPRFMTGQIGMGILYLLTAGLCFIGSIIDLVNYRKLALEYNQKMAAESFTLMQYNTAPAGQGTVL